MPAIARKTRYTPKPARKHGATVRIPGPLCEEAQIFVVGEHRMATSLKELVVDSLKEKIRSLKQQSIDDAFSGMATDAKYQKMTQKISEDFATSDWHSLGQGERQ